MEALEKTGAGAGSGVAGCHVVGVGPGQVRCGSVEAGSAEQLPNVHGESGAEPGHKADSGSGGELRGVPHGVGQGRQGDRSQGEGDGWCRKGGGWTLEAIEWWWDSREAEGGGFVEGVQMVRDRRGLQVWQELPVCPCVGQPGSAKGAVLELSECPRPGPQGPGGGQAAAGGGEGAKRRAGTPPGNKGAVRKAAGGKSHAAEPVVEEEMEEVVVEETGGKDKLMAEATQLLKSLRMKKLKAARLSKIGE